MNVYTTAIAIATFLFAGFVLWITKPAAGGLDTSAVALVGPMVGAVASYFFHQQTATNTAGLIQSEHKLANGQS